MIAGKVIVIAIVIFLGCHLWKDSDFPEGVKNGALVALGLLVILYIAGKILGV